MKTFLTLLMIAAQMFGQGIVVTAPYPPQADRFVATANTTALTVQQPASGARQVWFEESSIYCASASTATSSWNGTAASATTVTIKGVPVSSRAATATAWSGSNVGAGTTGIVFNIPAGSTVPFDLRMFTMGASGTATNFTWTTSNSCTITIQWREQ